LFLGAQELGDDEFNTLLARLRRLRFERMRLKEFQDGTAGRLVSCAQVSIVMLCAALHSTLTPPNLAD
jgi:hypothetical protein